MKDPALLEIPEEHVLAAFAAMMLGSSPLDPPPEAATTAAMATRLAKPGRAQRPGDVEGTRAFRSVYALAREQAAQPRRNGSRSDRPGGTDATKAAVVLASTLELRHRQRAALALRYVFGIQAAGVARILGLSQNRTVEVIRAATANVSTAAGGRIDVARHLRAVGTMVRSSDAPAVDPGTEEPRSVVKLLISAVAESPAARGRATMPAAARPVYNVRAGSRPASRPPALPHIPERKPRRTAALLAACVAALAFLGAFAPIALLRPATRLPLATVPIAPAVQDAVQSAPAASVVATGYRVRQGDTLWSIAGTTLGDPSRWHEVWRSNAGTLMTDGSRFLDPDLIRPGWKLRLPPR